MGEADSSHWEGCNPVGDSSHFPPSWMLSGCSLLTPAHKAPQSLPSLSPQANLQTPSAYHQLENPTLSAAACQLQIRNKTALSSRP